MKRYAILVVFFWLLVVGYSLAGECLFEKTDYIEILETVAFENWDPKTDDYRLYCASTNLGCANYAPRWAGPNAAHCIRAAKACPYRQRAIQACSTILDKNDGKLNSYCYDIMAHYGVAKAGNHDIFRIMQSRRGFSRYAATLGDNRATPILIKNFGAECLTPKLGIFAKSDCLNILDALYHLADPASREFMEEQIANNPNPIIKERAERALTQLPKESK